MAMKERSQNHPVVNRSQAVRFKGQTLSPLISDFFQTDRNGVDSQGPLWNASLHYSAENGNVVFVSNS